MEGSEGGIEQNTSVVQLTPPAKPLAVFKAKL